MRVYHHTADNRAAVSTVSFGLTWRTDNVYPGLPGNSGDTLVHRCSFLHLPVASSGIELFAVFKFAIPAASKGLYFARQDLHQAIYFQSSCDHHQQRAIIIHRADADH